MRASLYEPDSSAAVSDELGAPLDLEERISRGRLMADGFQIIISWLLAQSALAAIDVLNRTRFGTGMRVAVAAKASLNGQASIDKEAVGITTGLAAN